MYIDNKYSLEAGALKQTLQQKRILVVGDIMLDRYWFGDTSRISPEAPVPIINIDKFEDRLGGAANVASNIANLGANISLLGCIGQDEAGLRIQTLLTEACINSYLQQDEDYTTILKLRVLARQQQMLRLDFENQLSSKLLNKIYEGFSKLANQYDLIILSDYNKGCLEQAQQLISIANQFNIPIFIDPKGSSFTKYKGATVLTPNHKELESIVGSWNNEEELYIKAQNLREQLNLQALLVTRSIQGMTLFTAANSQHFPAKAKEVFDVSGAGDTVIAVFASLFTICDDMFTSAYYANLAAGIVVGKIGTSAILYDELFEN